MVRHAQAESPHLRIEISPQCSLALSSVEMTGGVQHTQAESRHLRIEISPLRLLALSSVEMTGGD